ncbi:MFS transporter, FHS family, L-fucose permease [Exophiala aquamarina CBS 119918]|uniref:MFS transporter, FHS family, L-fucose permease n=1 Tax=Exophiala aquamarina CBS 119918 TaxID=1182545 RepID=A0A072PQ18_9EURO|nr:MFS transporter, FHS family, L-fucose permease [Exophiala aquamarina CBS 119918]KEF61792.1 MFS transporter, FHS family, L-fucose permease [Exophiala aquamarina CBS 119918]
MGFKQILSKRSALRTKNTDITVAAQLTLRQSLWPLSIVTILFFLWGFAYGLLDTLNKHFQNTLDITRTRSSGLQAAYFGAYPLASLGYANWILRHWGYKSVFIFGLCLYGIGALMMWPAGVYRSFGGFCGATFIIGSGLGSLETAANPYLAVCGPPRYAEIRINFAQAFNAVGTVVGPVLGSYVFFVSTEDTVQALKSVQWVYLGIAIFVFILAFVFYISYIPEITDADMEFQVQETHVQGSELPFRKQYRVFHAAFAQFTYCGAQVAIASYFINYVVETRPGTSSSLGAKFLAGAQGAFTVGRFSGTLLMHYARPRWVFLVYLAGVVIFLGAATGTRNNTGLSMMFIVLFFESVCFPTIVALGIRGLGRHYKRGSGLIVGGVIGGACVPALTGKVADIYNDTGKAMVVPTMFMVATLTYALCVNFVAYYRVPADLVGDSTIGLTNTAGLNSDEEKNAQVADGRVRDGAQVIEVEKLEARGAH